MRRRDRVGGRIPGLAQFLELGFDRTQIGGLRFERDLGLFDVARDLLALGFGFALAQQPQQLELLVAIGLQALVALGNHGLGFELFEVAAEFAQDVFDPGQVLARVVQPVFGLAAAFLVLRHTCGFFEEDAQFIGLGLDDAADHPLPDDGVGARAEAGAEENVLDVAAAHRLVVDQVGAVAVAREHAFDRDFGVLAPLPGGAAQGVVEHEFDRSPARRLAGVGAVEDHVLHRLAAQFAGLGLAEHPAGRVDDVGLAATIGADDAHELARHLKLRGVYEGLETRKFDLRETHGVLLMG